ncbi:MAG: hypothetical protein HY234_01390 [Acidobacteria bacterium]|nr:hypothetical protein [Acidobacteriota bacterium]
MRIVETIDVISAGSFFRSHQWKAACRQVKVAVGFTDWPHGTGRFTIRPEKHGNGVMPIKIPCIRKLKEVGWRTEELPKLPAGVLTTGDLDALQATPSGNIGFEWETGNISSSHRAINKLVLTLHRGGILGGFLVVPSAALYRYLTDRVGNIVELRPYFPLWRAMPVKNGCLRIIVVEHDETSKTVRRIPKGTDGRARR